MGVTSAGSHDWCLPARRCAQLPLRALSHKRRSSKLVRSGRSSKHVATTLYFAHRPPEELRKKQNVTGRAGRSSFLLLPSPLPLPPPLSLACDLRERTESWSA